MRAMAVRTETAAHEAQKLFFEIGMAQRVKVGAALNELGLGFAQAHALRMLDPDEPRPMSALAERLFCDASNVTGLVDRREEVMALMSEPPEAIASLSVADQRALRDILARAVEQLR